MEDAAAAEKFGLATMLIGLTKYRKRNGTASQPARLAAACGENPSFSIQLMLCPFPH